MLWVNIALVTFLFMSLLPPYSLCTLQMKVYRQENVFDEINPGEYVISDQDPTAHDKCLCVLAPDRIAQCHNVSPSLWIMMTTRWKVILSWRSGQASGTSLRMPVRGLNVTGKLSSDKELCRQHFTRVPRCENYIHGALKVLEIAINTGRMGSECCKETLSKIHRVLHPSSWCSLDDNLSS